MFYIFLNRGKAALKHSLKQRFLPEMLYFHALASSSHRGTINEPEKGKEILNDYAINLS